MCAKKLVPFMALFYVLGCTYILCINYDYLWPAVRTICTLAFTPGAAAGGPVGSGIMAAARYGVARGLFSNEKSGMGSAPIVAAAAQTKNPVRQALVSATGTFWDTVVVCLMTGLVLVSSIMKNPSIDMAGVTDGGILTNMAFEQIPVVGPLILVVGIVTFAYSTILGWSYYGERGAEYLWGKKGPWPLPPCVLPCAGSSARAEPAGGVGPCRHSERADGRAEPCGRSAAFGRGGKGRQGITLPAPERWRRQMTRLCPP